MHAQLNIREPWSYFNKIMNIDNSNIQTFTTGQCVEKLSYRSKI